MRDCRGLIVAALIGCGRTTPPPGRAAPAATGAVTTVVPNETDARVTQVEEMLRGVPGLDVTRLPDGGYQLRIRGHRRDRKSTRLNSSHSQISYAVFCLKKKKHDGHLLPARNPPYALPR